MNPFPADDARLKALILHISLRCGDWGWFDLALLDRLLFQADFLHFRLHGFPITGQTYLRGLRSPAPEGLRRMARRMIQAGELEIREEDLGDGLHVRIVAMARVEPDLRIFDGQEIAVVERVLWFYRMNWSGAEAPDLVDIPWELAELREEIPYALALISGKREGLVRDPTEPLRLPAPGLRLLEQSAPAMTLAPLPPLALTSAG